VFLSTPSPQLFSVTFSPPIQVGGAYYFPSKFGDIGRMGRRTRRTDPPTNRGERKPQGTVSCSASRCSSPLTSLPFFISALTCSVFFREAVGLSESQRLKSDKNDLMKNGRTAEELLLPHLCASVPV